MKLVRALLFGLFLFFATLWLPLAAAIYTPAWYEAGCSFHHRCQRFDTGQHEQIIGELTQFLSHRGDLLDPEWSEKETQHLREARDRLDLAMLAFAGSILALWIMGRWSMVRVGALVNIFFFLGIAALSPWFTFFWRDIFHPLLFSNNLWVNTPADLSFYIMPRRFFFWTIALGVGCAILLNGALYIWTLRVLKGSKSITTDRTKKKGDAMKQLSLVALGLVLGVLGAVGYQMTREHAPEPVAVVMEKPPVEVAEVSLKASSSEGSDVAEHQEAKRFDPDIELLRKSLPGNQAVPPADEDETWVREEAKKSRNELYGRISSNVATDEEVDAYYSEQSHLTQDSIVMLEWLLKTYADDMGTEDLARHNFLLEQFTKRLDAIPDRKERAMTRIQKHRKNGNG